MKPDVASRCERWLLGNAMPSPLKCKKWKSHIALAIFRGGT